MQIPSHFFKQCIFHVQGHRAVQSTDGKTAIIFKEGKVESCGGEVRRLCVQTSMGAVGERAEYLRTGLDWSLFKRNLFRILSMPDVDQIIINSVIDVLSAAYFEEHLLFA